MKKKIPPTPPPPYSDSVPLLTEEEIKKVQEAEKFFKDED